MSTRKTRVRFRFDRGSKSLRNLLNNIVRLAAGDLAAKAMSFFAFVYLARILGVASFGVLEFAGSVLAYLLVLADGGLEMWATREAANTTDLPALALRVLPLRMLLASGSFVFLMLLLPMFPRYPHLRAVLLLYGLTVFAQAINLKWAFMGCQNMTLVARGLAIGQALFAVTVVAFIHSSAGLVWVPILRLAGDLATAFYFARWFGRLQGRFLGKMTVRGMSTIFKPALMIGLSLAMGLLNYNFDAVLLGFLRGPTFVGWYNAAYKLILVGVSVAITYFAGLFPALARLYVENLAEFRIVVRRTMELWLVFVVPFVVGGTFLAGPLFRFLFGIAYENSVMPFRILVWSAAFVVLRWAYMDSLRATGHQALDLRCAITSASLNVGLNVLLIPHFGMVGAASATTLADIVWFGMAYYYFRRVVLPGERLPSLRGPLVGGTAMALVLWLGKALNLPTRAGLGLIVYLSVQVFLGRLNLRIFQQETLQK